MNFSELSNKTLLGQLLRLPLHLIPHNTVVPILRGPLRGTRWVVGASSHGCWLGSYEHDTAQHLAERVHPGAVAYDIGANVGWYTLLLSMRTGGTGKVIAFEPLPDNVLAIRRHLSLNGLGNVTIVEGAVSDHSGEARFAQGESHAMGQLKEEGDLLVQIWSLDDWILQHAGPPPDVIKIDVEGSEAEVLRGASSTLASHRPVVLLALHGHTRRDECREVLTEMGYSLAMLAERDPGPPDAYRGEVLAWFNA